MPTPITVPTELLNRATAGNAEAQFALAELYMQSEDEDDIEHAEEWALKAASLGYVEAMYWLGEGYAVYAKDLLEDDPEEANTYFGHAFNWLKQAAELKHASATLELASFYRRGYIVEVDVAHSISLVQKAAEMGEVQAMRDLACIYEHGLGTDVDDAKADEWNAKAQSISEK